MDLWCYSMENKTKDPKECIQWLTAKLRGHCIQHEAENIPPYFQSERTRTEKLPFLKKLGHVQKKSLHIDVQEVNKVSIKRLAIAEVVPIKIESRETGQLVSSTQRSGE